MSHLHIRDVTLLLALLLLLHFFCQYSPHSSCISHRHKSDDPTVVTRDIGHCGRGHVAYIVAEEKGRGEAELESSSISQQCRVPIQL